MLVGASACRDAGDDITIGSTHALRNGPGCLTTAHDGSARLGTKITTNRTYDHMGDCGAAYVLDLDDYDASYNRGTYIADADAAPTTQLECERLQLRVYTWRRNADGTGTFLGAQAVNGTWVRDLWGGVRCEGPHMVLDRVQAGYQYGGDYRFGMRSQSTDASGNFTKRRIYVETLTSAPPLVAGQLADSVRSLVSQLTSNQNEGVVNPAVTALFDARNGASGIAFCRMTGLDLAFNEIAAPSLADIGANPATIQSFLTADRANYNSLCVPQGSPTAAQLQTRLIGTGQASLLLLQQIATALGVSTGTAQEVASRTMLDALGRLMPKCGTKADEINDFVHDGTLPAGMTGPNILLRNCAGSAASVRQALGLDPRGLDPRPLFQCVNTALADLNGTCQSPIADGGSTTPPGGSTTPPPTPSGEVDDCTIQVSTPCPAAAAPGTQCFEYIESEDPDCGYRTKRRAVETAVSQLGNAIAPHQVTATRLRTEKKIEGAVGNYLGIPGSTVKAGLWVGTKLGVLANPVGGGAATAAVVVGGAGRVAAWATNQLLREEEKFINAYKEEIRKWCKVSPSAKGCEDYRRCPEFDLSATRGFYSTPMPDGGRRPIDFYDRINHCLCNHIGPGTASAFLCPDADDRLKQECLTNPFTGGPNDGPRRDCVRFMEPPGVDRGALLTQFCQLAKPACGPDVFTTADGGCGCPDGPRGNPEPADLCKDVTNALRCGEDIFASTDLATCGCQSTTSGSVPFGGRPGCRTNPASFPGGRDAFMTAHRDDVFLDRRYDVAGRAGEPYRDVLMFKSGYRAAVTPSLRRRDFEKVGDRLKLDVYVPVAAPKSGYKGAIQAYCSCGNTNNRALGQVELQQLPGGKVSPVLFTLTAQDRQACCLSGDGDMRVTIAVNTESGAPANVGVAGFDFDGAPITNRDVSPVCDANPLLPYLVPRTWTLPDGTIIDPREGLGSPLFR